MVEYSAIPNFGEHELHTVHRPGFAAAPGFLITHYWLLRTKSSPQNPNLFYWSEKRCRKVESCSPWLAATV